MTGSLDPGPSAEPAGLVAKPLSPDGSHFVFGSTSRFAAGGNEGHISIYDRDIESGVTQVASNDPAGNPIPCVMNCSSDGIAELAISKDGSRVLLGQLVEEREGHKYWHLYMDLNDAGQTFELTPAAVQGVQFDGMTADGGKVFFSSDEHLTGEDEQHTGADIFMWSGATNSLTLISTGDGSSCDPAANTVYAHWNTTGSKESCGALAVAGGGGVGTEDGTVYFLSPELLDGSEHGIPNAPNLYVDRPGSTPRFVVTLESTANVPLPPKAHPYLRSFGTFIKPTAVAITEAPGEVGDSYVLDAVGETLQKFDPQGNLVMGFGKQGLIEGPSSKGAGTLISGSTMIESVTGNFAVGETIAGTGITAETTIEVVNPGSLQISRPATFSGPVSLRAKGSKFQEDGIQGVPGGIAVDNDPSSPSYRDVYVPESYGRIEKFSPSGEFISQIQVGQAYSGVAVDQANGDLYVTKYFSQEIEVFSPEGEPITSFATSFPPATVAVTGNGTVYVAGGGGLSNSLTGTVVYAPSSTSPLEYTAPPKSFDPNPSFGVTVDPQGSVFIDEGTQVSVFDPSGHPLGTPFGVGLLKEYSPEYGPNASIGLAASSDSVIVSNPGAGPGNEQGNVVAFGSVYSPRPQTDNPLVIDSVRAPETRNTGDFQVTPSGNDAAFTSALAGSGDETAGHTEVYRYNAPAEEVTCVSCTPTGAPSAGDSSLAANGLSLTDEGRVFFNTTDQLAAGDTNEKQDVYEWEPQGTGNCTSSNPAFSKPTATCLALISDGTSAFDSGLLGASADGTDAFFFTRDDLVPQDKNGSTVRIYDAREGGGFPLDIQPPACKASDECHGAASPAPPPLQVGSESGTSHQYEPGPKECKKGFVLKHGKCVKKHAKKHHKRANHKRGGRK